MNLIDQHKERVIREERFAPLGILRLGVLACLGGDTRQSRQYVPTPEAGADVFAVYRGFVQRVIELSRGQEDLYSLGAAARLLTGDIAAADEILDTLRSEPFRLDHGAGFCVPLASKVLAKALPLPADFPRPTPNYLAGSPEQAALRAWLAEHRATLVWDEAAGVYRAAG